MSSASSKETARLALVSSFYGPGATIGWYLTALSCVVSFGVHVRKREIDAITADLIATLAFPSVAAGDLISHVHSYSRSAASARHGTSAQSSACIEASLIVIESFLAIDVVLLLQAVGFKCIRRGCLLAATGLFCFAGECYLSFSPHMGNTIYEHLGRCFLVTFKTILIKFLVTLWILAASAMGFIVFYSVMPLPKPEREATDDDEELTRKGAKQDFVNSDAMCLSESMTVLALPLCFFFTMWPFLFSIFSNSPPQWVCWIAASSLQLTRALVPKSNNPVKDLDQVIALLAGVTVIGFNLYSVANSYHEVRLLYTKEGQQRREFEPRRLAEQQIELVRFGQVHRRSRF